YVQVPGSLSPDGKMLAVVETSTAGTDIWMLTLGDGKGSMHAWLNTPSNEGFPDWSPDGRWLAYVSDESGRSEVYVQAYPGPGPRYQLSRDGGTAPAWSRDGHELFYLVHDANTDDPDDYLMISIPVTMAPAFSFGVAPTLFAGRFTLSG